MYGLPTAIGVFMVVWIIFRPPLRLAAMAFAGAVFVYTVGAIFAFDTPSAFQENGLMFTGVIAFAVPAIVFSFASPKSSKVAESLAVEQGGQTFFGSLNSGKKHLLAVAWDKHKGMAMIAAAVLVVAWFVRYDVAPIAAGDRAGAYVLDRWTGSVIIYSGNKYYPTERGGL